MMQGIDGANCARGAWVSPCFSHLSTLVCALMQSKNFNQRIDRKYLECMQPWNDIDPLQVSLNLCVSKQVSPGLVVMGDDSCSRGHGFKSQCRILDRHDIFHIDFCKIGWFV